MKSSHILFSLKKIILFTFLFSLCAYSQDRSDEFALKKATNYFNQGEFNKSLPLYKNLYSKNTNNNTYYQNYLNNLIQLKMFSDAIKIVEFQILRNPNNVFNENQLAQLYYKNGNKDKAFETWDNILNGPNLKVHEYSQIAGTLISERLIDRAILAYEMAQTRLQNPNIFLPTIARLYSYSFNYKKAFETFLLNVKLNPKYLDTTRRQILQMIERPEALEAVMQSMSYIDNKNPDHLQIQAAVFMQAKQYEKAINIITNPIFSKTNTLINFGDEARKLGQLELAEKAYTYILRNYAKVYHFSAFNGLLLTQIEKSKNEKDHKDSLYNVIDNLYLNSSFKNEIGLQLTYYSHLLFERHKDHEVIQYMDKLIKTIKLKPNELYKSFYILSVAYFYEKEFELSQKNFQRVPDTYLSGIKYLYLSAIELKTSKKNIENLNSILRQRNGLNNIYLNDEIKILLFMNKYIKSDQHIEFYSESIYQYLIGNYDQAIINLDKIKLNEMFELEKDRFKYDIYLSNDNNTGLTDLFQKYNSDPEWLLKKAKYFIKISQYTKAAEILNNLILESPKHYYAIEARRIIREL